MTTSVFFKKSIAAAAIGVATLSYAQQFDYNGITYKMINEIRLKHIEMRHYH